MHDASLHRGKRPTARAIPAFPDRWRQRWLVGKNWEALHRIAAVRWDDEDEISGRGRTVCGRRGHFTMPGMFSRLGLIRCARCCKRLGIPGGRGAPFNRMKGKRANA